jgi:hypothetical protein
MFEKFTGHPKRKDASKLGFRITSTRSRKCGTPRQGSSFRLISQPDILKEQWGFLSTPLMRRTILGKSRSRITPPIYDHSILIHSRCSSVCAYYTPFSDRPNLTVLTEVLVSRILWEQPAQIPGSADGIVNTSTSLPRMKATGVEFTHTGPDGQQNRVHVRKEVIVAAGAIGSPKVLELSGVGNSTYV